MAWTEILQRLEQKTQSLLQQLQQLQQANRQLTEELDRMRGLAGRQEDALEALRKQSRLRELAQAAGRLPELDEDSRRALKHSLQEYIREIDRCIALLNQ